MSRPEQTTTALCVTAALIALALVPYLAKQGPTGETNTDIVAAAMAALLACPLFARFVWLRLFGGDGWLRWAPPAATAVAVAIVSLGFVIDRDGLRNPDTMFAGIVLGVLTYVAASAFLATAGLAFVIDWTLRRRAG